MLEFVEETLQAKGDYHTAIVAARLHDDECFEYVIKKSGVHLCMEASSRIAGYSDATQARLMQQVLRAKCARWPRSALISAARSGNTEFLRIALHFDVSSAPGSGTRFRRKMNETAEAVLVEAAYSGNADCLRFVHRTLILHPLYRCQPCDASSCYSRSAMTQKKAARVCAAAVGRSAYGMYYTEGGSIECFRYAHDEIMASAKVVSIDAVATTFELEQVCYAASRKGDDTTFIQYAHRNGYPIGPHILESAMSGIPCLDYVHSVCGVEWSDTTTCSDYGSYDTMIWAIERGAPVSRLIEKLCRLDHDHRSLSMGILKSSLSSLSRHDTPRRLLNDRAKALSTHYVRYGRVPECASFDIRTRALRRLRAIRALVRAVLEMRRSMLLRTVKKIEDAWLAYKFAPVQGRSGYDVARASFAFRVGMQDELRILQ
jgi:hypothetical protein